nr:hypothetical protein [Tanacetum cinerariifolium]
GKKSGQGDDEVLTEVVTAKFMAELDILMKYKHLNVIGLVGYCDEEDEKIIVYEYAFKSRNGTIGYRDPLHSKTGFLTKESDIFSLGKLDKLVFEGIKEQIVPQSIFFYKLKICFREDYEKWEPKLPKDYIDIIQMSRYPEFYSTIKKEELYNIFLKGILLQQDKVLLSFVGNGERNEMVSATMFSHINSCPHELKSLQES